MASSKIPPCAHHFLNRSSLRCYVPLKASREENHFSCFHSAQSHNAPTVTYNLQMQHTYQYIQQRCNRPEKIDKSTNKVRSQYVTIFTGQNIPLPAAPSLLVANHFLPRCQQDGRSQIPSVSVGAKRTLTWPFFLGVVFDTRERYEEN